MRRAGFVFTLIFSSFGCDDAPLTSLDATAGAPDASVVVHPDAAPVVRDDAAPVVNDDAAMVVNDDAMVFADATPGPDALPGQDAQELFPDAATSSSADAACMSISCIDAAMPPDAQPGQDATVVPDGGVFGPGAPSIAYTSNRAGAYDIYIADRAGTNVRQLTMNDGDDFYPAYSPDGTRLVFSGARNGQPAGLHEIALATGVVTPIPTPGLDRASTPAISPDGCCIAFEGVAAGQFSPDVYMLRAGMAMPIRLTNDAAQDGAPVFAPNSQRIYFMSNRMAGAFHVFSMALDGTGVTRETMVGGVLGRATVSPDGTKLAYARLDAVRRMSFIAELDLATDMERRLTEENDYEPWYGAGGNILYFGTARFGGSEVMSLDLMTMGAMPVRLTNNAQVDGQPTSSP